MPQFGLSDVEASEVFPTILKASNTRFIRTIIEISKANERINSETASSELTPDFRSVIREAVKIFSVLALPTYNHLEQHTNEVETFDTMDRVSTESSLTR